VRLPLRELRRLRHAAAGHAQDANQVFALEDASRLFERGELRGFFLQRLLYECGGTTLEAHSRNHLLDHVDELGARCPAQGCRKEHLGALPERMPGRPFRKRPAVTPR